MIAIRGRSTIAEQLLTLIDAEWVEFIPRDRDVPLDADRYLFCQGLLRSKPADQQTAAERLETMTVNLWQVTDQCERALSANPKARICVLGSESGFAGSHDGNYAIAKNQLHRYVETRRLLFPGQQLVCIAPSIIEDSGMTSRREDLANLDAKRKRHPKGRFLRAIEVAKLIHHVLYVDEGYLTNTVIRMNGGISA